MPTFNGGIYAMAYDGTTMYVGGSFTSVNSAGKKWTRTGLAAINATTGALLPWAPTANGKVDAMAIDPATHGVYIAGAFSAINGTKRDSIAEINGASGALDAFKHGVSGTPYTLAVGHGRLYLGGHITAVDSATRTNLAAFSLTTGALDTGWAPTADDVVYSIYSDTNRIYIGGKFHKINNISGTGKIGAVNPVTAVGRHDVQGERHGGRLRDRCRAERVWVGLGGTGGRVISMTNAGATQWTYQTDGDVQSVVYLNGVIYVGGHYDHACSDANVGRSRRLPGRFDPAGQAVGGGCRHRSVDRLESVRQRHPRCLHDGGRIRRWEPSRPVASSPRSVGCREVDSPSFTSRSGR